jgi:hypothetical protein
MDSNTQLYSYVVVQDTGLAPNPWHGYLTIALCTPNHKPYHINPGDWIVGNGSKKWGNHLIYAMRVQERLHFNDYFHDGRFQKKKPRFDTRDWRDGVGDNIYHQEKEKWLQVETRFHCEKSQKEQDTKYPFVYIAKHFFYFGEEAVLVPETLRELLQKGRQGCKSKHDPELVERFIQWLEAEHKPGHRGRKPLDWKLAAQQIQLGIRPRIG